jgi:hypothetical protein
MFAIRPAVFRKWIEPCTDHKAVAKRLEKDGYLIPRTDGSRRTRQVRIQGVKERRGYYCLREL